jgi:hypothetical protein
MSAYEDFLSAAPRAASGLVRGLPFWGDDPGAWDVAYLNGARLPGVAKVGGNGLGRRWDKVKTPGQKGASFVVLGFEPAQFDITLTIWTSEQLRQLESFAKVLRPATNVRGRFKPEDAVSVDHPVLAFYGIRNAIIMKPGFLEPQGRQIFELKIEFEEYFNQDQIGGAGATGTGVSTVKSVAPPISNLGPGAVGRLIEARTPTPAKPSSNNTGP